MPALRVGVRSRSSRSCVSGSTAPSRRRAAAAAAGTLAIDLQEQDDKYVLRADIPGLKPDDVQLEVEDDVLTVTGTHEQSEEEQRGGFVRRERRFGSFSRSLTLPKGRQRRSDRGELQGRRARGHDPAPERGERQKVTITAKAS